MRFQHVSRPPPLPSSRLRARARLGPRLVRDGARAEVALYALAGALDDFDELEALAGRDGAAVADLGRAAGEDRGKERGWRGGGGGSAW